MKPDEFLDYLWDGLAGTSVIATTNAEGGFREHFFEWPDERDKAIRLVEAAKKKGVQHIWAAPALFNGPSRKKENFKVAQHNWADWDSGIPEGSEGSSDLLVMTSPGKFHTYAKLGTPITDLSALEDGNKILGRDGADHCWNADRLLTVPGTLNRKKGYNDWEARVVEPSPIHKLPKKIQERFYNGVEDDRSSALYSIAVGLAELGTDSSVIEDLVRDADSRWGKFASRADGDAQIATLIERACEAVSNRGTEESSAVPTFGIWDFTKQESAPIDWVFEGLLYRGALGIVAGPPGVGKTQFCVRIAEAACHGRTFLAWKFASRRQERVQFLSYEMGISELNYFIRVMSDLNLSYLNDKFFVNAPGQAQNWLDKTVQDQVINDILNNGVTGVIVDSLGSTTEDTLNDDKIVKGLMKFADRLRIELGVWCIFLHHQRKPTGTTKASADLASMYGNMYIGGRVRTSLVLLPTEETDILTVSNPKQSIGRQTPEFRIKRNELLQFEIDHSEPATPQKVKRDTTKKAQQLLNKVISDPGGIADI